MESFYVTLPSNVINQHLKNKIGSYVTYLPSTLRLDKTWKVGLSEIHYTNSWFNLKNYNEVKIVRHNDEKVLYAKGLFLDPGRYTDINELLTMISFMYEIPNDVITQKPVLSYDPVARRVTQKHGKTKNGDYCRYKMDRELEELLGVENGILQVDTRRIIEMSDSLWIKQSLTGSVGTLSKDVYEGRATYDLTGGIRSLYVYSDVVDFTVVGDVMAQLLRVVEIPTSSKFGENVVLRYERPHYKPLATKDISTIEIDIKDDSGEPIDFRFGRTEITLHFVKNG